MELISLHQTIEEPAFAPTLDPSHQLLLPTPQEYDMLWGNSTHRKPMSPLASFVFVAIIVGIMIAGYYWFSYLGSKSRENDLKQL